MSPILKLLLKILCLQVGNYYYFYYYYYQLWEIRILHKLWIH